jgi:hypothetical protein
MKACSLCIAMPFSRRLALTSCECSPSGIGFLRGGGKKLIRAVCSSSSLEVSGRLREEPKDLQIVSLDPSQCSCKTHLMDSQSGDLSNLVVLLYPKANSISRLFDQPKEAAQVEQLGAARGAKYRLTEQGRAAVESQAGEDD